MLEMTDLAGVRVIVYYNRDVDSVVQVIRDCFTVDVAKSTTPSDRLHVNEFGYRSAHLIVSLPASRVTLPEWRVLGELKAEVQIRTVLQHAWAAISHALHYKHEAELTDDFSRRLFRLAGLLELADEEFAALQQFSDLLRSQAATSIARGDLSIAVARESLDRYVENESVPREIVETARTTGFWTLSNGPTRSTDFDQLVSISQLVGLSTIEQLNTFLGGERPHWGEYFRALLNAVGGQWGGGPAFYITLLVAVRFRSQVSEEWLRGRGWSEIARRAVIEVGDAMSSAG